MKTNETDKDFYLVRTLLFGLKTSFKERGIISDYLDIAKNWAMARKFINKILDSNLDKTPQESKDKIMEYIEQQKVKLTYQGKEYEGKANGKKEEEKNTKTNKLILTVGLPRSGKTTWARKQNYPIVNPDSIRLSLHGTRYLDIAEPMVWAIAQVMVRSLFYAGHNTVIVDATNVSKKRRDFWASDNWEIEYVVIPTLAAECIQRAKAENDLEIIPIIEKMADEYDFE